MIFAETHVVFRSPGHYDDVLHVDVRPTDLRRSSVRIAFRIRRESDDRLIAEGWGTLVGFDYATQRAARLPEQLVDALRADGAQESTPDLGGFAHGLVSRLAGMTAAAPIRITEFTDPGCPWAWNAEPVRARIDYLYGEFIEWRVRLVGLSESPRPWRTATTRRRWPTTKRIWHASSACRSTPARGPTAARRCPPVARLLRAKVHRPEVTRRDPAPAAGAQLARRAARRSRPRCTVSRRTPAWTSPSSTAGWRTRRWRSGCAATWPWLASRCRPRGPWTTSSRTGPAVAATPARATRSSAPRTA